VTSSTPTGDNVAVSGGGSRLGRVGRGLLSTGTIFILLIGLIAWIAWINPVFLEPNVFLAFIKRAAPLMILAAGQLYVIVSGEFDLSVGSLVTVVVVVAARLSEGEAANTWWVIALLFGIGLIVGLVNGLVTTRLRVPSFITTLGMLLILSGAVFLWTGGAPRGALAENFREFGRGNLEGFLGIEQIPYSVIVLLLAGALATWLLHRTNYGHQVFAVGGNPRAAALSGSNVATVRTMAFVLSATLAVVAGILLGGFGGVSAQVGQGLEFDAIAAVVLGGAVLGGGRGSMIAAMAGALTLEALFTLLNLLGVSGALEDAVTGVIIIAAVAYASLRGARSG